MPPNDDNGNELYELALSFFHSMEFKVKEKITLIGTSGKKYQFDMLIESNDELEANEVVVNIVDWKRAVGVDRLIRFERMVNDLHGKKGMVESNRFSDPATRYAKKHGLIIYAREHLQIVDLEEIF